MFSKFLQVAAGNGTSAMVTKEGELYIFGKDSSQSDYTTGQVSELKGQIVTQVAVGKAHIVALTKEGDIFTFGMNNKGQCGRDFPPPKENLSEAAALAAGASANNSPSPLANTAQALAAEGVDDLGSDPDVDVEHEGDLATNHVHHRRRVSFIRYVQHWRIG